MEYKKIDLEKGKELKEVLDCMRVFGEKYKDKDENK